MSTRGKDRILFASDYPVLSMERCLGEAAALDLTDEVRDGVAVRQRDSVLLRSEVTKRRRERPAPLKASEWKRSPMRRYPSAVGWRPS